jgi:hypothetical protein
MAVALSARVKYLAFRPIVRRWDVTKCSKRRLKPLVRVVEHLRVGLFLQVLLEYSKLISAIRTGMSRSISICVLGELLRTLEGLVYVFCM